MCTECNSELTTPLVGEGDYLTLLMLNLLIGLDPEPVSICPSFPQHISPRIDFLIIYLCGRLWLLNTWNTTSNPRTRSSASYTYSSPKISLNSLVVEPENSAPLIPKATIKPDHAPGPSSSSTHIPPRSFLTLSLWQQNRKFQHRRYQVPPQVLPPPVLTTCSPSYVLLINSLAAKPQRWTPLVL